MVYKNNEDMNACDKCIIKKINACNCIIMIIYNECPFDNKSIALTIFLAITGHVLHEIHVIGMYIKVMVLRSCVSSKCLCLY